MHATPWGAIGRIMSCFKRAFQTGYLWAFAPMAKATAPFEAEPDQDCGWSEMRRHQSRVHSWLSTEALHFFVRGFSFL
jgi:hypothetical protein